MGDKNSEQIKLEVQEWQITNALVGILGVLAPAACLAFILGHSGTLIDFILNIDHSNSKASPHQFHRWLTTLIFWPLRCYSPTRVSRFKRYPKTKNPMQVWRDGSLLCTLVNTAVPGACKDPREHRLQPPKHGVKLVMEYLDIQPIFTNDELNQPNLTPQQEKKFSKYLHEVHQSISKQTDSFNNMRYSTDYVARGMGLVIGEQNRKSTFYIYPIPKHNQQPCDLEIIIKGPCGNNGHITIPSILHHQQKWQPPTEYRRALYMSSKLNSISPTMQGTSFLRKLSLTAVTKTQDPSLEIDIRVKISPTRAKVTYVPQKTGVYEVSLVTRNCHVVGSPYSVPIELATSSSYFSNDSDNESDEANEGKYIKRKKKIISRIVDFIDEKMLLQNDGTLVKIDGNILNNNNTLENKPELLKQNTFKLNETIDEQTKTESVNTNETNLLETDNLKEKYCTSNEIATSSNIARMSIIDTNKRPTTSQINPNEEFENKPGLKENIVRDKTSLLCNQKGTKVEQFDSNNNNDDIRTQDNSVNERQTEEISKKYDFKETLDKFNINFLKEETNLPSSNYQYEVKNITNEEPTPTKDSEIKSYDTKTKEIKTKNNSEKTITNQNTSNKHSRLLANNIDISTRDKLEENNNIIFNVSKSLLNNTEPNYFSEKHIIINNLDEAAKVNNSFCFTPDILETSKRNTEKSAPFTKNVNDDTISINSSPKSSFVDPTLVSKVHDPALDFAIPVSEHRKTFSKKDPSKDLTFPVPSNYSTTKTNNYLVNNLVKVFDARQKESSSIYKQVDETNNQILDPTEENGLEDCPVNMSPGNDPDLVQCHTKNILREVKSSSSNRLENFFDENYYSIQKGTKNDLQDKLKSVGDLSNEYDKNQCYLKDCLQNSFEQHAMEHKLNQICHHHQQQDIKESAEKHNTVKLGIVDKQKQFWNQKTNNFNRQCLNNNTTKQKIILKDSFVIEIKDNINKASDLQYLKPFEGIVENKIKIFETKLASTPITNSVPKSETLQLQKSKSESFLQEPKENKLYQIQKTVSDEEIIKIPSIEERRNKFLQACQQSFSSDDMKIPEQKLEITSVNQSEESNPEFQDYVVIEKQDCVTTANEIPKKNIETPRKIEKKQSFKRKARFKRAKIFFHHLEGSDPKINIEEESENLPKLNNKITRSESDSCVSYEPTDTLKSLKISDRFQVDDLFQDILGDDKRFIGIPNKMAVVASLASLDSDSSRAGYDSENEGETDMDYFNGKPKKIKRKKDMIPGFHDEYPHLPTTNTWRYKSRNNATIEELIPGRDLLTNNETDFNVT